MSRQAVQRILALRQCVPLLGLTGLCLVEKPSLITPDEELEGVCVEIRVSDFKLLLRTCLLSFSLTCEKMTSITRTMGVTWFDFQNIVDKINFDVDTQSMLTIPDDRGISLSDFEIGDPIAKGCNAVVYRARYDPKEASCPSIQEEEVSLL